MARLKIHSEIKDREVQKALKRLIDVKKTGMKTVFSDIGEYMLQATEARFNRQIGPNGRRWADLHPQTRARKRNPKILTESRRLRDSIIYRSSSTQVEIGTNVTYAAIHQFGGTIHIPARSQQVFFRQNLRTGEVGNRFAKKGRSNFSQWVTLSAYSINMPARPFLGVSSSDREEILAIVQDHYQRVISG